MAGPVSEGEDRPVLKRALNMGEDGDWQGMADTLLEALEDDPDDPVILCWLGTAERELGLEGVAYERFRRCLAGQPEDPLILATAGTALASFDDPEAEPALRAAAKLAPNLSAVRWRYGAFLSREGLFDDALRELDAARESAPEDPTIRFERAVALGLKGDLDEAAEELEACLELEPSHDWALLVLGLVRVELGEVDAAALALVEGARERPEDVEAQCLAALALAGLGRDGEAYEMVERARMRAEGAHKSLVAEVEERVEEGSDEALAFLHGAMAPSTLRERFMARP